MSEQEPIDGLHPELIDDINDATSQANPEDIRKIDNKADKIFEITEGLPQERIDKILRDLEVIDKIDLSGVNRSLFITLHHSYTEGDDKGKEEYLSWIKEQILSAESTKTVFSEPESVDTLKRFLECVKNGEIA